MELATNQVNLVIGDIILDKKIRNINGGPLTEKQRLQIALSCLELAKEETEKHGRYFMKPHEDVFDCAVHYGGSINLTREEVLKAYEKNKNE